MLRRVSFLDVVELTLSREKMLAFIVLIAWATLVNGWESCSVEDGGGICPNGNKCCSTGLNGSSSCIAEPAHEFNGTATCCPDNTGCGPGYECATSAGGVLFCRLYAPPTDDPAPLSLPRYKNCAVKQGDLQLHGLNVAGTDPKFAYFSSLGSLEDNSNIYSLRRITHVFIDIHGSGRNAEDYFCSATASVPSQLIPTTLVIAPWFLAPQDEPPDTPNATFLRWNENGPIPHTWRYGAEATDGVTSSYQALDRMMEKIMFDVHRFPSLQKIIVAGHSAGGQYTHRWALTSSATFWGDSGVVGQNQNRLVPVRVVAANPRSFCYLDNRRYNHKGELRKPTSKRIEMCPTYNGWEWGLELNGRIPLPRHLQRDIAKHGGDVTWLIQLYSKRDLVYLAGSLDILEVRSECEDDDFQGGNRFERSRRYFNSLHDVYGTPTHHRLVAEGVPHDHSLIFQSSAGQLALFGDFQEGSGVFLQSSYDTRSDQ